MPRSMARLAARPIWIACRGRLSVDALPERLYFVGMALCALCRRNLSGGSNLMRIAVARLTSSVA